MHTDPELIALLALGEPVGTEHDHAHAQTCPVCADELTKLRQVVTLGRSVAEDDALIAPSSGVWARIRDELALDLSVEPPAEPPLLPPQHAGSATAADDLTARARLTPVHASWSRASGTATLSTDGQGRRVLEVALQAELPTSGVRQAWLVHRDDPAVRQSLGILDGLSGLWTVDHSVDLEQYPILDISQQGMGETEHSGDSLVQGRFTLIS
jgi:hypothetical protein